MINFNSIGKKLKSGTQEAHILFLIIALPAVFALLYFVPISWGQDEQVHTARAYQISQGNLYPDSLGKKGQFGGTLPKSLVVMLLYGHSTANSADKTQSFLDRKDLKNTDEYKKLAAQKINSIEKTGFDFGPTGPYAPVVYLPSAAGLYIGSLLDLSVGQSVMAARFIQALVGVGVLFFGIRILRNNRIKWILFLVALLPSTVYQTVTINADAYTISIVLVFLAVISKLFLIKNTATPIQLVLLFVASIALMFTKPSYAIFLGLILFLPKKLFTSTKQNVLAKTGIMLVSIGILSLVSLKGLGYSEAILLYRPDVASQISLFGQLDWMLRNPLEFLHTLIYASIVNAEEWGNSMVGVLGYNSIKTPYVLIIVGYVALFLSSSYAAFTNKKTAILLIIASLVSMLSILVLLYGTFNVVGGSSIIGVQGRYFVPCVPFLLIGLSAFLPVRVSIKATHVHVIFGFIAATILYVTVYAYIKAVV